jgi:hypothetical protein
MRLSRWIPTTNALPARHTRSASPDMIALLRAPAALVCRPRGRQPSLLPLPVHAAILLGFERLPRMQVRPAHAPAPPSTLAARVLIALCVSLSEVADATLTAQHLSMWERCQYWLRRLRGGPRRVVRLGGRGHCRVCLPVPLCPCSRCLLCASLPVAAVACVLSVHADCRRLRRPVGRCVGRGWTGTAAVLSHGVGRSRDSCCVHRYEESRLSTSQVAADGAAWSGRSAGSMWAHTGG